MRIATDSLKHHYIGQLAHMEFLANLGRWGEIGERFKVSDTIMIGALATVYHRRGHFSLSDVIIAVIDTAY